MLWFPDTIARHRTEINAVERILSDLAARRQIRTYRDVTRLVPECNFRTEHAIYEVISHRTNRARGVMLSAVIVGEDSSISGSGFYDCARDLGRIVGPTPGEQRQFHQRELERVFREYEGWLQTTDEESFTENLRHSE